VILERFLEAKIFKERLSTFAKNNQSINIGRNIALDESVKKPHVPSPLAKVAFIFLLKNWLIYNYLTTYHFITKIQ
jgi:hypothetical protein